MAAELLPPWLLVESSMSDINEFPRKPPGRAQLHGVCAQLAQILEVIADELADESEQLMGTTNVTEFASVVHSTAQKLTEASERWNALSKTIRDHWK